MTDRSSSERGACPSAETLAQLIDGKLPERERAGLLPHVADCRDCREVIAETTRLAVDTSHGVPASTPVWRASRRRVAAAAGVLAVAATLALAVGPSMLRQAVSPHARLIAEIAPARPAESRLSDFPYAPQSETRAADATPGALAFQVQAAVADVRALAAEEPTTENLHALGVGELVLGDIDAAVAALERAAGEPDASSRVHSDYAAVLLARAAATGRREDFGVALAAAERALALDPALAEARFNQALALEGLLLAGAAQEAWQRVVELDTEEGWADEARAHLEALERMPPIEQGAP